VLVVINVLIFVAMNMEMWNCCLKHKS